MDWWVTPAAGDARITTGPGRSIPLPGRTVGAAVIEPEWQSFVDSLPAPLRPTQESTGSLTVAEFVVENGRRALRRVSRPCFVRFSPGGLFIWERRGHEHVLYFNGVRVSMAAALAFVRGAPPEPFSAEDVSAAAALRAAGVARARRGVKRPPAAIMVAVHESKWDEEADPVIDAPVEYSACWSVSSALALIRRFLIGLFPGSARDIGRVTDRASLETACGALPGVTVSRLCSPDSFSVQVRRHGAREPAAGVISLEAVVFFARADVVYIG